MYLWGWFEIPLVGEDIMEERMWMFDIDYVTRHSVSS